MRTLTTTLAVIALTLVASAQLPQGVLAQFRVTIENGKVAVMDAKSGRYQGGITVEKWKSLGASTDKRHMALDVTAAVIAGGNSREHTVDPKSPVVTLGEGGSYSKPITLTEERGHVFLMASDTKKKGRYEAIIYMVK